MKRGWIAVILTVLLIAGIAGTSYADIALSGHLRVRAVTVDNSDSTSALKDGGFFEQRTRLNANATIDDNSRVFLQLQDSRMWGSETNTASTGTGDISLALSQGYLELKNLFDQPLTLMVGRQGIAYGEHRLIGTFEWSNNARRFDAIKLTYNHDVVDIDLWTGKLADAGQDWGNDTNLNVLYAKLKNIPQNDVDLYIIQKVVGNTDTNFYTIGARVKGGVEDFNVDYTAEVAKQSGDATSTTDQDALAYAIRAGYTLPDVMGLRVGVEYDSGTGDDTSTTDNEAFDNLYPTNHYLYGYTDDVGWSNMQAWSINASLKPTDNLKVGVEYWNYKKDEKVGGKDDNGTEINVKVNHKLSKNINCEAAYVIRDAGDVDTKAYGGYGTLLADKTATFGYFMVNVKFM